MYDSLDRKECNHDLTDSVPKWFLELLSELMAITIQIVAKFFPSLSSLLSKQRLYYKAVPTKLQSLLKLSFAQSFEMHLNVAELNVCMTFLCLYDKLTVLELLN